MDIETRQKLQNEYDTAIEIISESIEALDATIDPYSPDESAYSLMVFVERELAPLKRKRDALHKLLFGSDYTEPRYDGDR